MHTGSSPCELCRTQISGNLLVESPLWLIKPLYRISQNIKHTSVIESRVSRFIQVPQDATECISPQHAFDWLEAKPDHLHLMVAQEEVRFRCAMPFAMQASGQAIGLHLQQGQRVRFVYAITAEFAKIGKLYNEYPPLYRQRSQELTALCQVDTMAEPHAFEDSHNDLVRKIREFEVKVCRGSMAKRTSLCIAETLSR